MSSDPQKLVTDWLWKKYPAYKGWEMCIFAWEYDVSSIKQEIASVANDAYDQYGRVSADDLDEVVARVIPPEGFAYTVLQKDNVRVGFNVPKNVFQGKPA